MTQFFPRQTVAWHVHEPPAFRRLTLRLVPMALLAGVVARVYRVLLYTYGTPDSLWMSFVGWMVGVVLVAALVTLHLGSYPVRHWVWRAPAMGALLAAAEVATSAALIALGMERSGTAAMHWAEWRARMPWMFIEHTLAVCAFAAVLGAVVQVVRLTLLRREHRASTAHAIHVARTSEQVRRVSTGTRVVDEPAERPPTGAANERE